MDAIQQFSQKEHLLEFIIWEFAVLFVKKSSSFEFYNLIFLLIFYQIKKAKFFINKGLFILKNLFNLECGDSKYIQYHILFNS